MILSSALCRSQTLVYDSAGGDLGLAREQLLGFIAFRVMLVALGLATLGLSCFSFNLSGHRRTEPKGAAGPKGIAVLIMIVLIAAAALRLYQLESGLWHDEILTNVLYIRLPFRAILTTFESENQHFLYSLLARASVELFGESAWALRLPAVVFGVGSIWALYLLGREVLGSRPALLAAALMTVSYTHIWFSQNARGYSGLLMWTLLSSWLLLRGLRDTDGRPWLGFALTAALGMYTHFTMVFVLVGQFAVYGITLLARRREAWPNRWAGLFLGFGLGGLLTLLLYALVLPQLVGGMGRETSVVAEWKNPLWTILEVVRGLQIGFQGGVAALAAAVVFLAGLFGLARRRWEVAWLMVVPPIAGAAVVVGLGHHLWPRFFFFAIGFAALIVIHGADHLGARLARWARRPDSQSAWAGTALCLALVLAAATSIPAAYGPKQDFQGALEYIEANLAPGDRVVTAGLSTFTYQRYYQRPWEEVRTQAELDLVRSHAGRTWLVYTFPTVLRSTAPEVMESIQQEFQVMETFGGTVSEGAIVVVRTGQPGAELSGD